MFTYATKITALCSQTGHLVSFSGPLIRAISRDDAQRWCDNNGFGYCIVEGVIVSVTQFDDEGLIISQTNYDRVIYN